MISYLEAGEITAIKKLHNSKMGNPRFSIRFKTADGVVEYNTAPYAGFTYAITGNEVGKRAIVTLQGIKNKLITDIKVGN